MIVILCSQMYLNEQEVAKICKTMPIFSSNKLIKNLVQGMDENKIICHLINIQNLPSYPRCKQLIHRGKIFKHSESIEENDIDIGFIDLPVIKLLIQERRLYKYLDKYISKHSDEKIAILSYGRDYPNVVAISKIKNKYPRVITCTILGDLTGKYAGEVTNLESRNPRVILAGKLLNWQMKKAMEYDSFVLLTEYMSDALKLKKPFCVVEGVGTHCEYNEPYDDGNKRVITYAGALVMQYNLQGVIEAFQGIHDKNYELWFFGDGPAKKYIQESCTQDTRIKYFGIVSPDEIKSAYDKSTALLNPRQNTAEYTKYTFPSKTMESLLSGRPLIAYKLDGIPEEYDEYINYVPDNSVEALRNKMIEVCSMSIEERKTMTRKAWEFMIQEKCSQPQSKKIIDFLQRQFNS